MNRRNFIKSTTAALATSAYGHSLLEAAEPATGDKPNILLIMTDEQHARMLSCTGNPNLQTPALDDLAREGIRFERAYATNPVCVPSRISMATGMMPARLGALDNGSGTSKSKLPPEVDENSLGKLMKRAGYDTFYGGKTHMNAQLNPKVKSNGYDEFEPDQRHKLPEACLEFMTRKRENPFFALASFINPHDICFAYSAYKGKNKQQMAHVDVWYKEASLLPLNQLPPLPDNFEVPEGEPDAIEIHIDTPATTPKLLMRRTYDEREWRIYRYIYCRLTELIDRHIGKILSGLKAAGLEKNTLVVFVSDHGDMDSSHRLPTKGLFYEESAGVPFIMRYPSKIPKGKVDNKHLIATGLDILPTLCDYAGIKPPKHLLGRSLRPVAEGKAPSRWRSYVASENEYTRMIRSQRYKYCAYDSGNKRESLVDMEKDPGEMRNLASDKQYKQILNQHRQMLKEWVATSNDSLGSPFLINS